MLKNRLQLCRYIVRIEVSQFKFILVESGAMNDRTVQSVATTGAVGERVMYSAVYQKERLHLKHM